MGLDELDFIVSFQRRINYPRFKKGAYYNYIVCAIFFWILHFDRLINVLQFQILFSQVDLQSFAFYIQGYLNFIPYGVTASFTVWIMLTLIFSIIALPKKQDNIKGVRNPRCHFCNSKMITDYYSCTNPDCQAYSHQPPKK